MARNPITQARNVASARTTLTYPRNPIGGVYIPGAKSIEGATGDTPRTTAGWIENEKYRWYVGQSVTGWSAEFDTAVTRTGTKTVKLSNTDTSARALIYLNPTFNLAGGLKYGPIIKPSTSYTFKCWAKTTTVATNGVYVAIYEMTAAWAEGPSGNTNKLSGTNDWTLLTRTFTTAATAKFLWFEFHHLAGAVSDVWFDANSMQLIENGIVRNPVV